MSASLKSPIPTPVFVNEAVFSHKSAKVKSRLEEFIQPPRPPVKSAPPVSRVFKHTRRHSDGPQRVSFSENSDVLESPHYNSRSRTSYFEQCFEIVGKLGQGSFGEVFRVQSKDDGCMYAVKKSRVRFRGEFDRQQRLDEVKKHERLRFHPNCVKLIQAWEERQQLYIQTELCDMSLTDFCEKNNNIDEKIVWEILVDLTQGLKHLHDNQMIHMDIKPANVLIGLDGLYKIADFGLVLDISKKNFREAQEGDPKYLAPELLEGKFSKAADIFSLGISLLEVACDMDLPRGGDTWQQLRHRQIPRAFLQGLSPELSSLIRRLMDPLPQNRPTVDEILREPGVVKANNRRKRLKFLNSLCHNVKRVLFPFSFLLFWLWQIFVIRPLKLFNASKQSSLSSQELFNEPSLDSSLSSEDSVFKSSSLTSSADESFSLKSSSPRNISRIQWPSDDSLDISPNRNSALQTCMPTHSPWLDINKSGSFTPPLANSSPQNYTPPLDSVKARGFQDAFLKTHIGPKNLLEVFEDAARDKSKDL